PVTLPYILRDEVLHRYFSRWLHLQCSARPQGQQLNDVRCICHSRDLTATQLLMTSHTHNYMIKALVSPHGVSSTPAPRLPRKAGSGAYPLVQNLYMGCLIRKWASPLAATNCSWW